MRTYTKEELSTILENHNLWTKYDSRGVMANLIGADLSGADLSGAHLSRANLIGADLCKAYLCDADLSWAYLNEANLSWVNLRGANLGGADLSGVNLRGADLYRANLRGANLGGANLIKANLSGVDLSLADIGGANLSGANLGGANLIGANLSGVDLSGADIGGANLSGANLCKAKNIPFIPMACPDSGSYIAYKKTRDDYIVVLEIPSDALRSSASSRKCRASSAKVLRIENIDGSIPEGVTECRSKNDLRFVYRIGELVSVPNFDTNRWNECAPGIHHFINRQEAVEYR